jgi:Uma2 family endonuclease
MAVPKPCRTDAELWAELCSLPDHLKGQIIDGELIVQPRPRPRHALTIGALFNVVGRGTGFPGDTDGWWILIEPGIELPGSREIVPDLAGWRRSTMPELDLDAPPTVRPDWACEVLSPSNTRTVIVKKQAAYARAGVEWLWLVNPDPVVRTLQIFRLDAGSGLWLLHSTFSDEATARVPPFDIDLAVDKLWF